MTTGGGRAATVAGQNGPHQGKRGNGWSAPVAWGRWPGVAGLNREMAEIGRGPDCPPVAALVGATAVTLR